MINNDYGITMRDFVDPSSIKTQMTTDDFYHMTNEEKAIELQRQLRFLAHESIRTGRESLVKFPFFTFKEISSHSEDFNL